MAVTCSTGHKKKVFKLEKGPGHVAGPRKAKASAVVALACHLFSWVTCMAGMRWEGAGSPGKTLCPSDQWLPLVCII